jgi:type I restriction enzyme S subunit
VIELSKVGIFSKGKGILKEQVIASGLPCIRYGEIYTTHDFIIKEFKSFISEDVARESQEIKNGDILFAGSGETLEEIGKSVAYIGNEKAYAGGDVIILSTNGNVKAECLSYALETDFVRKQKRRYGQGQQVVHIYPSDLAKVKVALPPLPEQKAIAHILGLIDTAINKNNQLIAQKELRKKWLMQNLLTGKKRLRGFGGKWEIIKLGEDCELITKGTTPTSLGQKFQNEGVKFIKIESLEENGTIIPNKVAYISEETNKLLNRSQLKENDILISIAGALGRVAIVGNEILPANTNQALAIVRLKKKSVLHLAFLFYFLNSPRIKKEIEAINVQAAQANLSLANINDLKIHFPSGKEQTAIAQVLQAVDKEIQLLKNKTEKLREQKKGLMQVLLTGKKRLKV